MWFWALSAARAYVQYLKVVVVVFGILMTTLMKIRQSKIIPTYDVNDGLLSIAGQVRSPFSS